MRLRTFLFLAVCFVFVQSAFAQTSSTVLLREFLAPDSADAAAARLESAKVFRIYKRGTYDDAIVRGGGGAYYSFVSEDHSYNHVPQIELQNNDLSVAFYGANYGFITDLGKTALASVDLNMPAIKFIADHKPADTEDDARALYRKAQQGFVEFGASYNKRLPAVVGNTYALRAVSFREADTLVAFKVHRVDANGSLVIFWKKLKEFDKPQIAKTR